MQIKLQKFTVIRDGVSYSAGSVMELPKEEAEQLLSEGVAVAIEEAMDIPDKISFDLMTVAELKKYCNDHDIDTGKAKRKAEILALLNEAVMI